MADLIFSECGNPTTILDADLFQDGNMIQVASDDGFPDLNLPENAGKCFLVTVANACYSEILKVTVQNGLLWTVERAQGACDVPLTFFRGDIVTHPFSSILGISLNQCCTPANGGEGETDPGGEGDGEVDPG